MLDLYAASDNDFMKDLQETIELRNLTKIYQRQVGIIPASPLDFWSTEDHDASQLTRLDLALKWEVLVESNPVVKGKLDNSLMPVWLG